jgi:hypothetical protein
MSLSCVRHDETLSRKAGLPRQIVDPNQASPDDSTAALTAMVSSSSAPLPEPD